MLVVVMLLGVIVAFSIVLLDSTLATRRAAKKVAAEGSALRIAHAGVAKAIYCLNATSGTNCGGVGGSSYPGESNISFGEGSFTTIVTTVNSTTRNIASTGTPTVGRAETVLVSATTDSPLDSGIAFSNAVVAGNGGIFLNDTSSITGDVRSDDNFDCNSTSAHIYGVVYVSKPGARVLNCTLHSDVRSDRVRYSVALRDVYYRGWSGDLTGTTVSGISYSGSTTSSVFPLPVVDIPFWRAEALKGGIIEGNFSPSDGSSLGPVKINGDLTVNGSVDVTLTGTIWVTGDILIQDTSTLSITSTMGQFGTVVLADSDTNPGNKGQIDIRQNVGLYGSGNANSFLLFVSTNTSDDYNDPAIMTFTVSPQAAFLTPYGLMRHRAGATTAFTGGKHVYINYDTFVNFTGTSLNTAKFGSVPPGTWRVLPGTYREQ